MLPLIFVAVLASIVAGVAPPSRPQPAGDGAAHEFSSRRALTHVRAIAQRAHPLGSPQSARVRRYIVRELRKLGLRADVQRRAVVQRFGGNAIAGRPSNVVGVLRGERRAAVLLVAHHDSVPGGPGAADDGAGVAAILELLRAMRTGAPPRNSVIALLSDGEEAGLLGARAFVDGHPRARDARVAIVLEARGTSGPSVLVETAPGDERFVDAFAATPRPAGNSVLAAAVRSSPASSDLAVLAAAGIDGGTLSFASGAWRYHTALDTPAALDESTLQHQGSQALALAQRLADEPLEGDGEGERDAAFVALPLAGVARAPATWPWSLAALAGAWLVLVLAILAARRGGGGTLRGMPAGLVLAPAAALLGAVAGGATWAVFATLRPGMAGVAAWQVPEQGLLLAASVAAAGALCGRLVAVLTRRWPAPALAAGTLAWWPVAASLVMAASLAAGAVVAWAAVAAAAGTAAMLAAGTRRERLAAAVVLAACAAFVLVVAGQLLRGVALVAPLWLVAGCAGWLLATLPLARGAPGAVAARRADATLALAALALLTVAVMRAGASADRPGHTSLVLAGFPGRGNAAWIAANPRPDAWTRSRLGHGRTGPVRRWLPFADDERLFAAGPALAAGRAPRLALLRDVTLGDRRLLCLRARPPRGARQLVVTLDGDAGRVTSVAVDGRRAAALDPGLRGAVRAADLGAGKPWTLTLWAPKAAGTDVAIAVAGGRGLRATATAVMPGLPRAGSLPPSLVYGPQPFNGDTLVSARATAPAAAGAIGACDDAPELTRRRTTAR